MLQIIDWDAALQPVPEYEVDQRINWREQQTAIQTRCGVGVRVWQTLAPDASLFVHSVG